MILSDASSDEDDSGIAVMSRYGIYHHSWLTIVMNYFRNYFSPPFSLFFLIIIYKYHNILKFSEPPKTTREYRRKVSPPSSRKSHTSPQASSSSKPGKRKVNDPFTLHYIVLFYLFISKIMLNFVGRWWRCWWDTAETPSKTTGCGKV